MPATAVLDLLVHPDQALRFQRPQQPAEIPRIKSKPLAQRANIGASHADLEQQPSFSERAAASQITILQRAGPLGHDAIEATNLPDLGRIHPLTLVRKMDTNKDDHFREACQPAFPVTRLVERRRQFTEHEACTLGNTELGQDYHLIAKGRIHLEQTFVLGRGSIEAMTSLGIGYVDFRPGWTKKNAVMVTMCLP